MITHIKSMAMFANVVQEGSFRKAAASLSLSPSVVSQHIGQLETHLGAPLFYRSTRQLSLTDYGKRFYPYCQQMVQCAQSGIDDITLGQGKVSGKLTVTLPEVLCTANITKLFARFCQQYPHIELSLEFNNHKQNIIEKNIDLSIRIGWLEDSNLRAKKITDIERIVCASAKYLAKAEEINNPEDLSNHYWIKAETLPAAVELQNKQDAITTKFNIKKGVSVKGANILKEMLLADFGLAIVPKFIINADINSEQVVHILPKWKVPAAGMYFVWIDNKVKNPLINYFTDYVEAELREQCNS